VPLPERVFSVADGIEVKAEKIKPWEMHSRFVSGTYNGWIDLNIETLTPLFIRGAMTRNADVGWDDRDARLRPHPYTAPDGTPVIPGSSLRGMVRNLVEIIAFAKVQPVTHVKPFFRSLNKDRIGRAYSLLMLANRQKPKAGLLIVKKSGEKLISPRRVVQVLRTMLKEKDIQVCGNANSQPEWRRQYQPCWVKLAPGNDGRLARDFRMDRPDDAGWQQGTLVLTGHVENKRHEFVFLASKEEAETEVEIPDEVWDRFHDEGQITRWQQQAFPADRPDRMCRKAPGHLRDGEPVFFLTDEQGKVKFLGRPQMFRLPYDLSPLALIPETIRHASLDLAEAMFGCVSTEEGLNNEPTSIKGRVYFDDVYAVGNQPQGGWYEEVLVPMVLSSPKPTTFQHYLTQDGSGGKEDLTTYLKEDSTTIRGHKLYWHRWDEKRGTDQIKETGKNYTSILRDLQSEAPNDKNHTLIRPVKPGIAFQGRVWFENLTDLELGALLEALQIPDGCCHRLGMGKPLGLGSVRLTSRLQLVDRTVRYASWQGSGVQVDEDASRFHTVFVQAMLKHARDSREPILTNQRGLRQIARLDALYRILTWSARPTPESTAYMRLDGFRNRPILPSPHRVAGVAEPPWPSRPPRAGLIKQLGDSRDPKRGASKLPGESTSPAPTSPIKPVQKSQTLVGTLKRRDGAWYAVFEGDPREAMIRNQDGVPSDCDDGIRAHFYVEEQSKRGGIKVRFDGRKR
jgi:CRISPR-associated protein (TIGR03986 family)